MARRVQLRRTKGYRKPEGAVVVARPSKWGNPFQIRDCIEVGFARTVEDARRVCTDAFRDWLVNGPRSGWWWVDGDEKFRRMWSSLNELRGRDLACWCPLDSPCHADVLLDVANATTARGAFAPSHDTEQGLGRSARDDGGR